MAEHAERFSGRVSVYERYRPGYPAEVLEVLRERCGLREGAEAADIGAGTGMVTELLLRAGCRVTAVEPNAEMRAACERLLGGDTGLRIVDAAAEATGLATDSCDLVTVGRAFHWFDRERALREFARILRPGGWLVLLSNRRAEDRSDRMKAYETVLREYGNDDAATHRATRSYEDLRPFGEGETLRVRVDSVQAMTMEELAGLTQSYSVSPLPGDARYAAMQAALERYFAQWSEDGVLRVELGCELVGWRKGSI